MHEAKGIERIIKNQQGSDKISKDDAVGLFEIEWKVVVANLKLTMKDVA